jgi:Fic/DOC family
VPGPTWDDDDPGDVATIAANTAALITALQASAAARAIPPLADVLGWHAALYAGCALPVAGYAGHLRGDSTVAGLVDYEVIVGPKQGVWSSDVGAAVTTFLGQVVAAVTTLDAALPVGARPTTVAELNAVVSLTAVVHGEWVRIHPFANGNGRTGRVWAAWLALRYGLPVFVAVKPRPNDAAYAQAAFASMGNPPHFVGDHSVAVNVFTHLLSLSLLP